LLKIRATRKGYERQRGEEAITKSFHVDNLTDD
jgi:hypothetical protein